MSDSPILAQVGKLFHLRGVGILVALHVEIIIHISVVLIIGFIFEIWPYGLFNEFPEYGWAIGSVVIGIRIEIDILIELAFLLAAVLPDGRLRVLFAFNLTIDLDFSIGTDGHDLHFGQRHRVNVTRIGPTLNNLMPCGGRFQLASENGQTVFPDAFGGHHSFYFARTAGECCVPWSFDLQLVRFTSEGVQETLQESFRTEFCLNAASNPNPMDVLIVSNRTPNGFPPPLEMEVEESAVLRALARPVDETGNPIAGARWRDLRALGFSVQFFLVSSTDTVLDKTSLLDGNAFAILPGQNIIRVAAVPPPRIIDDETGEEIPFGFWPGAVLGFDIASFLARGLPPAVRAGDLPVVVNPAPVKVTVEPALGYLVDPNNRNSFTESSLLSLPNAPVWELERSEPFLDQRKYGLGVKLTPEAGGVLPQQMTLNVSVKTVRMEVLPTGTSTPQTLGPLKDIPRQKETDVEFDVDRANGDDVGRFFTGKLIEATRQFTLTLSQAPNAGQLVPVMNDNASDGLLVIPNNKETAGSPLHTLVPPGPKVADRHVLLSIEIEIKSNDVSVSNQQSSIRFAVTNEETFEEYIRVFEAPQSLVAASPKLSGFALGFYRALLAGGPSTSVLNSNGATLWDDACTEVQTITDDRPLYWTRLEAIAALRAYCKSRSISLTDNMVHTFEWPSRGLDPGGGISFAGPDAAMSRKAIITGFDPFFLPLYVDVSNPSGLAALYLNKKTLNPQQALFIRMDAATQGTWRGTYGADGYNVISDTTKYPAYAQVAPTGQNSYTWAASTAEVQALQKASGTDRLAAC